MELNLSLENVCRFKLSEELRKTNLEVHKWEEGDYQRNKKGQGSMKSEKVVEDFCVFIIS